MVYGHNYVYGDFSVGGKLEVFTVFTCAFVVFEDNSNNSEFVCVSILLTTYIVCHKVTWLFTSYFSTTCNYHFTGVTRN